MLLSICIPSYNRFNHLIELVESVLLAKSTDFEVVVVDNGSSQDIEEILLINDTRVRIIKREVIVKGPTSVRLALDYAVGTYAMICLDKDFILGDKLDYFLDELKKLENIACGYCNLNTESEVDNFVISSEMYKNIYRCGHPSGVFFRTEYIKNEAKELDLLNAESIYFNNPFLIDLLYAKCLCDGKQAVYGGALVKTETMDEAARQKSHSYSKKDNNIYFFPENRVKQFWIFLEHLKLLSIRREDFLKIYERLLSKTMYEISVGYAKIMRNKALCEHHGISIQKVKKQEILRNIKTFTNDLLNSEIQDGDKETLKKIIYKNYLIISIKVLMYF